MKDWVLVVEILARTMLRLGALWSIVFSWHSMRRGLHRSAFLYMLQAIALALLLTSCIEVTGVPEEGRYTFRLDADGCPVPAPIVNDMEQPPSTLPAWCPYQVRQPDGTLVTVTPLGGPDTPDVP